MKIRLMTFADINQVLKLHLVTLPETPSSKIGPVYLNYIYNKILSAGDSRFCLVADKGSEIIGVITATKDLKATQKLVSPLGSFYIIWAIIASLLRREIGLGELANRFYFEYKVLKKFHSPYPTILTLFVQPDQRKKGVGRSLIQTLIEMLKKERIREVFVDTLTTNTISLAFYKKVGFNDRGEFNDSYVLSLKL